MFDDGLPGLGELAVAARLTGQVHDHGAGLHPFHRRGGHQPRRGPARHQRGGDDDVEAGDGLLEFLLLLRALVLGEFAGIPALACCVDAEVQPLGAHRTDLIGHLGAHVVAGGAGAETFGGRQRLQAGHPDAEHQHRRRLHGAGRGGQHREEPGRLRGGQQHRFVAGDVGLRRQRVHHLRAGDPGNGFHGEGLHAGRLERTDLVVGVAGRQESDQGLARTQLGDLLGAGRGDLDDDVGGPRVTDGGAGFGVEVVGKQRRVAGAGLHDDADSALGQPGDRFGNERDAPLIGGRLGGHADGHRRGVGARGAGFDFCHGDVDLFRVIRGGSGSVGGEPASTWGAMCDQTP